MCGSCEHVTVCYCCGTPIYSDDDTFWIEDCDGPICTDCWYNETGVDSFTEETHLDANMTQVWLFLGYDIDKRPVWYRDKTLAVYDIDSSIDMQQMFKEPPKLTYNTMEHYYYDKTYVTLDMIKSEYYEDVLELFEVCSDDDLYPDDLYYFPNMSLVYPEDNSEESA